MKTRESKKQTNTTDNQYKDNYVYKAFAVADAICDLVDDWRLVPRVVIVLYSVVFWRVVEWFMTLPDPTTEQVAFVSAIVGVAAAFFGIYTSGGGKNNHDKE